MNENLKSLVEMSRHFGKNPDYIIAGGGNSSYKNSEMMWVKASGTSMATIDENGFVCLSREKMQVISQRAYSVNSSEREAEVKADLHNAIVSPAGLRPSVEASMHEVIDYSFVMHTHPTLTNGMLCGKDSKAVVEKLFGDEVIYIPYTDPGYMLFKEVVEALAAFRKAKGYEAKIIFLENHGVFVGAETTDEIYKIYEELEVKLGAEAKFFEGEIPAREDLSATAEEVCNIMGGDWYTVTCTNALAQYYMKDAAAFEPVSIPFTPDNIVYCKSKYLFLKEGQHLETEIKAFKATNGYLPKVIAVEGKGLIAVEESLKSAFTVKDVFYDMMKVSYLAQSFGGPRPMTQVQIDFIDNWEVENYRRQMSKKSIK